LGVSLSRPLRSGVHLAFTTILTKLSLYLKEKRNSGLFINIPALIHFNNLFNQSPINGLTYGLPQCIFHFKEEGTQSLRNSLSFQALQSQANVLSPSQFSKVWSLMASFLIILSYHPNFIFNFMDKHISDPIQ
jgi:hypothetical protein